MIITWIVTLVISYQLQGGWRQQLQVTSTTNSYQHTGVVQMSDEEAIDIQPAMGYVTLIQPHKGELKVNE